MSPVIGGKAALLTTVLLAGSAFTLPPIVGPGASWSAPANLQTIPGSGAGISTPAVDGCASLSPDGLSIAFTSNRTGNFDIYLSRRPSRTVGFGSPVRLPAPINTAADEACPTLATNNRIFFSSDRDDPAYDLYVAKPAGGGWSVTNLGPNINRPGWLDESAALFSAGGHEVMLFSSRHIDGTGGKIYQSVDGGPATLVTGGVQSSGSDNRPSITPDGRTIYFDSNRPGTLGDQDLYYATRSGPTGAFGPAVHLTSLSGAGFDARPFISRDGLMLTFSSARAGNPSPAPDIWYSTRKGIAFSR
jgi:Tol biopolymer transport system component